MSCGVSTLIKFDLCVADMSTYISRGIFILIPMIVQFWLKREILGLQHVDSSQFIIWIIPLYFVENTITVHGLIICFKVRSDV